jgi:asparagine synthase (glutamine-hydrolysing)
LNKSKKGFGVPVGNWKSWLKKELLSYIDKTFIEKQNIFYFETVSTLVNNHLEKLIIHLESGHSIVFKMV